MEAELAKKDLEKLIAAGREDEAIEAMLNVADFQGREVRALILLTSNKYKKLRHNQLLGKISQDNASIRSAEINSSLLDIIDQINWEPPDPAAVRSAQRKQKNRKRFAVLSTVVSLAALLVIIVLSAQYDLFNTQPRKQTAAAGINMLARWEGTWQHELESNEDQPVTGTLKFRIDEQNRITGEASNTGETGDQYTYKLFDISPTENGRILSGQWKSPEVKLFQGTFRLELDNKKTFSGSYTLKDQSGRFYWRGRR